MTRRLGVAFVALVALGFVATALAQTTGLNDREIQRFVLPGTNTTGLRVHAARTEMNLRLPAGDIWAQGGYKVAFTYAHGDNLSLSVTLTDVPVAGTPNVQSTPFGGGVVHQVMPTAGSIVAVVIGASTALTAGYAHAEATIFDVAGGTQVPTGLRALIGSPIGGNRTRYASTTQGKDLSTVPAGNAVGCRMSTSDAVAPVSAELFCTVVVEM